MVWILFVVLLVSGLNLLNRKNALQRHAELLKEELDELKERLDKYGLMDRLTALEENDSWR